MADNGNPPDAGFKAVEVKHDGGIWFPKQYKEQFGIKDGQSFKLIPVSTNPLKFQLEKIVALSILAMIALSFSPISIAHAQESTGDPATSTVQKLIDSGHSNENNAGAPSSSVTTGQPSDSLVTEFSQPQGANDTSYFFPISAQIAKTPLQIDITYPSGKSTIQNITSLSGYPNYHQSEDVGSGLITRTWSTEVADTYFLVFGQEYSKPTEQVARVTVYSNHTAIIPGALYQIHGTTFKVKIFVTTTLPVRQLTGEDVARPITSRLDTVIDKLDKHDSESDLGINNFLVAAGSIRFSNLVWVVIAGIVLVNTASLIRLSRKISSSKAANSKGESTVKAKFVKPFSGKVSGGD